MQSKSLSARSRIFCPWKRSGLLQKMAGTVVLVLSIHSTSHLILQSQMNALPRRSLQKETRSHPSTRTLLQPCPCPLLPASFLKREVDPKEQK